MGKHKFDPDAAFKAIIGVKEAESNSSQGHPPAWHPKKKQETKKRVSLVVLPSIYQDFQKIAYMERKSVSSLIADCMEEYILNNLEKLDEYENLIQK